MIDVCVRHWFECFVLSFLFGSRTLPLLPLAQNGGHVIAYRHTVFKPTDGFRGLEDLPFLSSLFTNEGMSTIKFQLHPEPFCRHICSDWLSAQFGNTIYHAHTLWLFTESDFMTTMVPISLFAMVAAPLRSPYNVPHLIFWLWFHLLAFNTSNQTSSLEDATNKPDRPIPARRISLRHAKVLRWTLTPACWLLSRAYSQETMFASMALSVFTWMYNELHGNSRSLSRYALNGLGFAAFEAGTTLVARDDKTTLDGPGRLAILLSGCIFATTIYAQDFRDVIGDGLIGRDTIPIRFGAPSRPALLTGIIIWSMSLSCIWQADLYTASFFILLGAFAGGRFVCMTTVEEDRRSYFWYNVWVSAAHVLPGYWRMKYS